MCIVGCIGHRPNETTSMFLSTLWEQRALFCTHQPLSPLCWFLIFIFLIQHLALFIFSDKICWESSLLLNDLSLICLSLYVLCILDCAGSILDGINGLHSKWCSLSRLFCLYYWDGLLSVFFPWWFEIVRFVQLLLNKILQMKKRNYMCAKFELWVIWEETTSFHWHDLLNPPPVASGVPWEMPTWLGTLKCPCYSIAEFERSEHVVYLMNCFDFLFFLPSEKDSG